MLNKKSIFAAVIIAITAFVGINGMAVSAHGKKKTATFKVRVENVASKEGVAAQDGSKYQFALSPGFYVISERDSMLFSAGKKASLALESQAEDGNPDHFADTLIGKVGRAELGEFKNPVGADMPSPIFSGGAFEFSFTASEGRKLNLATMFGQSNDLFYAPDMAIELFDKDGNPLTGDISDLFKLWDAGTEVNQAPGIGPDQGPRQKGPNTGAKEKGIVRLVNDGFTYPETKSVLRVTVTAE
jgi:hypothetical protein